MQITSLMSEDDLLRIDKAHCGNCSVCCKRKTLYRLLCRKLVVHLCLECFEEVLKLVSLRVKSHV